MHPDFAFLEKNHVYIIAINRPGYAASDVKAGYTMSQFAGDIKYLLDYLQIDKAALLGCSAGGLYF